MQLSVSGYNKQSFIYKDFNNSGKGFEIINTLVLFKSSFYLSDFISFDLSINITFLFKSLFSSQNMLTYRFVN